MQEIIAEEAAQHVPPDLYRQIDRHRDALLQGVRTPFDSGSLARHEKNPDGSGDLDRVIAVEAEAAVEAIRSHRPFAEIVFRLGVVSHYMADANNPLATSDDDEQEPLYYADFLRYTEHVEPKLPLLFYGLNEEVERQGSLSPLIEAALARSRVFYLSLGREYRRIGFASGLEEFDDRSTAFGIAAVSFSQAVTDVVLTLRYIWIRAGGIDERTTLPARGDHLIQLPRHRLDAQEAPDPDLRRGG